MPVREMGSGDFVSLGTVGRGTDEGFSDIRCPSSSSTGTLEIEKGQTRNKLKEQLHAKCGSAHHCLSSLKTSRGLGGSLEITSASVRFVLPWILGDCRLRTITYLRGFSLEDGVG